MLEPSLEQFVQTPIQTFKTGPTMEQLRASTQLSYYGEEVTLVNPLGPQSFCEVRKCTTHRVVLEEKRCPKYLFACLGGRP